MKRKTIGSVVVVLAALALAGAPVASGGYLTHNYVPIDSNFGPDHKDLNNEVTTGDTGKFTIGDTTTSSNRQVIQLRIEISTIESSLDIYEEGASGESESYKPEAAAWGIASDLETLEDIDADLNDQSADGSSLSDLADRVDALRTDLRSVGNETFQSQVDQYVRAQHNVSSSSTEPLNQTQMFETLATLGGTSVPGPAGNERFDVSIHKANGDTIRFAITTVDGRVEAIEAGPQSNPTVTVHADHSVVRDIRDGDAPRSVIQSGLDDGRITFDAKGILDSAIYGGLSTLAG